MTQLMDQLPVKFCPVWKVEPTPFATASAQITKEKVSWSSVMCRVDNVLMQTMATPQ